MTQPGDSRTEWVNGALKRYERPLIAYALRITGNLETARDVVQDTFLRLCRADRRAIEGRLGACSTRSAATGRWTYERRSVAWTH